MSLYNIGREVRYERKTVKGGYCISTTYRHPDGKVLSQDKTYFGIDTLKCEKKYYGGYNNEYAYIKRHIVVDGKNYEIDFWLNKCNNIERVKNSREVTIVSPEYKSLEWLQERQQEELRMEKEKNNEVVIKIVLDGKNIEIDTTKLQKELEDKGIIREKKVDKIKELKDLTPNNNNSLLLMEECAELQQAMSKVIRYGKGEDNKYINNLIEEIADVKICMELIMLEYNITEEDIKNMYDKKLERNLNRAKV